MKIYIDGFKDFAMCVLPDGSSIYGKNVEEVSDALDDMSEAGMFVQDVECSTEDNKNLQYNR